jgi:hypothetical protein
MLSVSVDVSGSGNNQIIAGVPGMVIDVLAYTLVPDSTVVMKLTDGAGGTELTGPLKLTTAGIAHSVPGRDLSGPIPLFSTLTAGADLTLNLSAGIQVSGHLTYRLRRV